MKHKILLLAFVIFLTGCSLLQKISAPRYPGQILVTGTPDLQVKDLNLAELLLLIDSTNQVKIDSAEQVIYDLKQDLSEQKREYEERLEAMRNDIDKERALLREQYGIKPMNKSKNLKK